VVSAGLGPSFQPMLLASVLCGLQGPHGLDIDNVTKRKYGFIGSKFSEVRESCIYNFTEIINFGN
jgi:hypothetical protein